MEPTRPENLRSAFGTLEPRGGGLAGSASLSHPLQTEARREPGDREMNVAYSCPQLGLPGGSDGEESACSAGDPGLIPGWGRSPGGGHGNPLQYSCLEKPMDRGAWCVTAHGVTKSWTRLSD